MNEKTKLESEYVASIQALRGDCEQLRRQVFERSRTFADDSAAADCDDVAILRLKLTEKEVQCVEFNRRVEVSLLPCLFTSFLCLSTSYSYRISTRRFVLGAGG